MRILATFLTFIVAITFIYGVSVFVCLEPNVTLWSIEGRSDWTLMALCFASIAASYVYIYWEAGK